MNVINIIFPNFIEEEKKFQHNLSESAGLTDAVSVDCIFEVLLYIQNHSDK